MSALAERGMRFDYPAIEADDVDLLLVTHEHRDHNGVEAIAGEPAILRSTAGTARVAARRGRIAIASEHDDAAGTERGPNTIFVFELGGLRVAHFGDFGQAALRPEQAAAIGEVDLLLIPVGGGPTIGGTAAAEIALSLDPAWVVPMHYRTPPRSTSSRPRRSSSPPSRRSSGSTRPASRPTTCRAPGRPLAVVPAAP